MMLKVTSLRVNGRMESSWESEYLFLPNIVMLNSRVRTERALSEWRAIFLVFCVGSEVFVRGVLRQGSQRPLRVRIMALVAKGPALLEFVFLFVV